MLLLFLKPPPEEVLSTASKMEGILFWNTGRHKTDILGDGRHSDSQLASALVVVVGVLLVLVFSFHSIERSNVNLVFSVSPPKLTWIALKVMIQPVLSQVIPPESQTPHPSPAPGRGHSGGRVMHQASPLARPPEHRASILWGP